MTENHRPDTTITAAARQVAAAELREKKLRPAVAAAEKRAAQVESRIAALDAERSEIAARRARGDHQPDDAGRVGLLGMDKSSLATMLAEAEATLETAKKEHNAAVREVMEAQAALRRAEANVAATALLAHAQKLAALSGDAARECGEAIGALGRDDLDGAITELGATANLLGDALLATAAHISAAARRVGHVGRPVWAPSQVLADTMRRLHLQAGGTGL